MFCTSCGSEMPEDHRFCHQCGTATGKGSMFSATVKPTQFLSRPREGGKIAGVCAGLARYIGIDVTLVRIMVICLTIAPPSFGLILYIVCWILMPKDRLLLAPPSLTSAQSMTVPS